MGKDAVELFKKIQPIINEKPAGVVANALCLILAQLEVNNKFNWQVNYDAIKQGLLNEKKEKTDLLDYNRLENIGMQDEPDFIHKW